MIYAIALVLLVGVLAYWRAPVLAWTLVIAAWLAAAQFVGGCSLANGLWIAFAVVALILNLPPLRRIVFTGPVFKIFKKITPAMSQTEQEAINAGTVWWDKDLFSGKPDWKRLLAFPDPKLSAEEQAFIDGPT
ncbi:MAG: acyl-CoA dehydrogenase, partial [Craterilacuibacter sp.]